MKMVKITQKMRDAGVKSLNSAPYGIAVPMLTERIYNAMDDARDTFNESIEFLFSLDERGIAFFVYEALRSDIIGEKLRDILSNNGAPHLCNVLHDYWLGIAIEETQSTRATNQNTGGLNCSVGNGWLWGSQGYE